MRRYIWPALFFAATAYMWNYNQTHVESKLIVPFVGMIFPDAVGDPAALGEASVKVALAISFFFLGWEIVDHLRDMRRRARGAAEVGSEGASATEDEAS